MDGKKKQSNKAGMCPGEDVPGIELPSVPKVRDRLLTPTQGDDFEILLTIREDGFFFVFKRRGRSGRRRRRERFYCFTSLICEPGCFVRYTTLQGVCVLFSFRFPPFFDTPRYAKNVGTWE